VALAPSLNPPHLIETLGFESVEKSAHMLAWLGRGPDFRRFIVNDVETELYCQTPGAQLITLICSREPELKTVTLPERSSQKAMVTDFSVTFPLTAQVKLAGGPVWKLDILHCYDATNLHLNDGRRKLRLDFTIVAHFQES
jgi:hypothetical protein